MSLQRVDRLRHFITSHSCAYPHRHALHLRRAFHASAPSLQSASTISVPLSRASVASFRKERWVRPIPPRWPHYLLWRFGDAVPPRSLGRRFATAAVHAAEPGTRRSSALLVAAPKPENVDLDMIDLPAPDEAKIQLTERAAEKLRAISMSEHDSSLALRISVESGGCHGYQYRMELTSECAPDDYKFTHPTHGPAAVVIDAVSLGLLKGSTVDYATELIGSSFRIVDNPQAKGSGCGCGISWEANL